jgi:hypothetical protein
MRWATVLLLFGMLSRSSPASAEPPRRFRLDYHGSVSCQQESELLRAIEQRAPTAARVADGPSDVTARVSIEDRAGQQLANVELNSADGVSRRELLAPNCAQLTQALALVLAIGIDADAGPPDEAASHSLPPPSLGASAPRGFTEGASVPPPKWWAAGLGLGLSGGVAPHPVFTQALSIEMGLARSAGFAAHVKLSGVHAQGSVSAPAGVADFDLLALRLASCPYRIGTRVSLSTCLTFDLGRLQGDGSHTLAERTSTAYWYGPGAAVAATFSVLPWLRLQLELGALMPLARDRFYFGPSETVHRIPALAGYGGINCLVGG